MPSDNLLRIPRALTLILFWLSISLTTAFACSPAPSCWMKYGPAYLKPICSGYAKDGRSLKEIQNYLDEPEKLNDFVQACLKLGIRFMDNQQTLSNSKIDAPLAISKLPSTVGEIARSVVAECKDAGQDDATEDSLDRTIDVYKTKNGERLAVFSPSRICSFKGNGVCDTDGCDVYFFSERPSGSWALELKQTMLDLKVDEGRGSATPEFLITVRGGNLPCKRQRSSFCTFELKWQGAKLSWKQLR